MHGYLTVRGERLLIGPKIAAEHLQVSRARMQRALDGHTTDLLRHKSQTAAHLAESLRRNRMLIQELDAVLAELDDARFTQF